MRTSIQILPGIKTFGWMDYSRLPTNIAFSAIYGIQVVVLTDIHPITVFDEHTYKCQTKKDDVRYEDTATLKSLTDKKLPRVACQGFVVTDVNDKSDLLGSLESPHPKSRARGAQAYSLAMLLDMNTK